MTFARIKPSLALVTYSEGKHIYFGTAFCIKSTTNRSYFITNKHVVGPDHFVTLYLADRPSAYKIGTVVARGTQDVAIVEIEEGDIPPLTLASDRPQEGQRIAIAGFPAIQVSYFIATHQAVPSYHAGSISALLLGGRLLEFDALSDHGNSGGPLFDVDSGLVYGIVTWGLPGASPAVQNNLALAISAGAAVMQTAGVTPRVESTNAAASVAPTTVAAALCQTPDTVGNDLEADWLASNYQQVDAAAPDVLRHYQECVSATSGERHYYFERQLAYFEGIAADTAVNFTRFSEACSRFETAISLLNDVIRNTTLSAARANAQGLLDQIQPTYDTHCAR